MQDNLIEKMIAESYKKEDSHITRGRLFQLIEHLTNDFLDMTESVSRLSDPKKVS